MSILKKYFANVMMSQMTTNQGEDNKKYFVRYPFCKFHTTKHNYYFSIAVICECTP